MRRVRRGCPRSFRRCSSRNRGRRLFLIVNHQNSNPPLRAPSATAFTRPW
jgi:hypothetical protein